MESIEISAFLPSSTEKESPMQQFQIFNLTGTDRGIDISKKFVSFPFEQIRADDKRETS